MKQGDNHSQERRSLYTASGNFLNPCVIFQILFISYISEVYIRSGMDIMSSDILASEMSRLVIDDIPSPTRSFEQLTSPPDTPTRPKRNPLRAQSHASLKDARQE